MQAILDPNPIIPSSPKLTFTKLIPKTNAKGKIVSKQATNLCVIFRITGVYCGMWKNKNKNFSIHLGSPTTCVLSINTRHRAALQTSGKPSCPVSTLISCYKTDYDHKY